MILIETYFASIPFLILGCVRGLDFVLEFVLMLLNLSLFNCVCCHRLNYCIALCSAKMTSLVATGSSQMSPPVSIQEKGCRNKRKFRADLPLGEPNKIISSPQNECLNYEFSAEKLQITPSHGQINACSLCRFNQDHSDGLKLDLGLSSPVGSSHAGPGQAKEEQEADEFHEADWSDLTEAQLEELVLSNLDAIFKSAITRIVACGYTEEVATKSILRSGICYGCKDVVSNIVDNTLAFLRNEQEIDPLREHCFEDLLQLEKYILAELVCVLQEVRPFFSTGDALWCLLICDMNVSHACAMDGDPWSIFVTDSAACGCSPIQTESQLKSEIKGPQLSLPSPSYPVSSGSHNSQSETLFVAGAPGLNNLKNSPSLGGLSGKEGTDSRSDSVDKAFSTAGTSQSPSVEEKFGSVRKVHSSSIKRDCIFRQKSLSNRTYASKGSSRGGKLSGLILDRKLKFVSDSDDINLKSASLKISKSMRVDMTQDHVNPNLSPNAEPSTTLSVDSPDTNFGTPNPNTPLLQAVNILPALNNPTTLLATDTDLSLSLSSKSKSFTELSRSACVGIPYDRSLVQSPQDRKDEIILKLFPRVQELQNQVQEWTEWANQKVMQAARRLGKDKAELKMLRQENEEVERLKKEKKTLEENTMKKLTEMENALCKACGQLERANATVRKLEVEKATLRREMKDAKLHAAESAASCQEASRREKNVQMKFQSWEKQRSSFQEELMTEKRKLALLLQKLEQAKVQQEQVEARWHQEAKAKEEILLQVSSLRKEREQVNVSAKSEEDMIKSNADKNLQRYTNDIRKLEKEIALLRQKTDSSKITALRRGIDGSYATRCIDMKGGATLEEPLIFSMSEVVTKLNNYSVGGVKRERECVMCLSEEMSVVFLPCAHQVVCTTCNELHEKQGMKDCPSCRSPIKQRISVRYFHK